MTPTDTRATIALLAPYVTIIAVMAFASWSGLDATIASLIAGGCLAAIDPRRGQSQSGATMTTGSPPDQTTVTTEPKP